MNATRSKIDLSRKFTETENKVSELQDRSEYFRWDVNTYNKLINIGFINQLFLHQYLQKSKRMSTGEGKKYCKYTKI